jgi:phenylalanyl-tRNA synthetase beta chain
VFPVLYDANRTVLSLPPLINGAHSAISLDTTDVFIECTATDLNKAKIVLNTVVAAFSQYSATEFAAEPVDVTDSLGETKTYPDYMTRFVEADPKYVNGRIGVDIAPRDMAALLCRMQLPTKLNEETGMLRVEVPPTRSDVLHACDIAEDVAIAHGYNNIKRTVPPVNTVGAQQPLNHFSDLVRGEMAMLGFSEVLTWILCSHDDNFANVSREDTGNCAAIVANPSGLDVQVARSSLLQGVLKAMGANKDAPLPAKLFEVGDVVLIDADKDVGARNARRLLVLYSDKKSGFEIVHGVLDRIMVVTGAAKGGDAGYEMVESDEATFFPGRQARIVKDGKDIGVFGIVHPDVLTEVRHRQPVLDPRARPRAVAGRGGIRVRKGEFFFPSGGCLIIRRSRETGENKSDSSINVSVSVRVRFAPSLRARRLSSLVPPPPRAFGRTISPRPRTRTASRSFQDRADTLRATTRRTPPS